jgi:hypothetical protein
MKTKDNPKNGIKNNARYSSDKRLIFTTYKKLQNKT